MDSRSNPGSTPLLETKFHPPVGRPGQVTRGRLLERLETGARGRLTLLSAPPGFGKTTLLAGWLSNRTPAQGDVAWLSLDEADDHAPTFWKYVLSALNTVRPEVAGTGAIELLDLAQPPPIETLLALVLNVVAGGDRDVTLVVDDYHVIESPAIHGAMSFMLDHLPPRMHVVIAGRMDPPLSLPRLRTRGELTEIRAADLRFTFEEASAFLNGPMDLDLSPEDVTRLEARTEGWVGALQLAALSIRGREQPSQFIQDFAGDDRYIVDYLVEEVLQRQEPGVRQFLLRTSILERLCAPLCDAVTGGADGRKLLESLERSNLFVVPLDDKRGWYRYHQLFADVLQAHLREEFPGEVAALYTRASDWYAENGEPDRAIRHALAAKDFVRAAGLIELQAQSVMQHHHPDRLIAWLKPIPDDVVRAMPVLSTYYGHAFQGMGDMEASAARLDDAERALTSGADVHVFDKESFAGLPARISLGRGYLAMAASDVEATVEHAERALSLLPPGEHHWRGTGVALLGLAHWKRGELGAAQDLHSAAVAEFERAGDTALAVTSGYHDAELLKARGRLNEAAMRCEASLKFAGRQAGAVLRSAANLHLGLSELHCERNDLDAAREELLRAEQLGIYPPRTPFRHCLARARLLQCEGDFEAALELVEEAERLQVRGAVPDYRPVAAWKARLHVAQGRLGEALAWARMHGVSPGDELTYLREYEHITLARVLLARSEPGDIEAAGQLLDRLLEPAIAGDRWGAAIEILALRAVTQHRSGDLDAAAGTLDRALTRAQPERYARLFIDEGPMMESLLKAAAERGVAPAYCAGLLAAMRGAAPQHGGGVKQLDALSERELEVLRLLATELSGPEMARELVVSLNTVRTHTKNVYAKLGVSSRRAAVRRAHELNLF